MPSFLSSHRTLTGLSMFVIALFALAVKTSLLPIATPTSTSLPFRFVPEATCDMACANKVYKIYAKNRSLFNQCVEDGDYQIFPHTGKYPNSVQLRTLVESPAYTAIFTAVLLADISACDLGSTPLRSAAEALLTLNVDIVDEATSRRPRRASRT